MSKFLLNLLLQISKALVNLKIQFLFKNNFSSEFSPLSPAGMPTPPALAYWPAQAVQPVEVVLRHFHRCRSRSSTTVVILLEGALVSWLLAMREYSGHEDLRGSGRRSVIPYIHRRKELYCCVLVLD
jgi:hypothetical protein